jgi:glyceraldehyde 3-phosphate dehydrogenase
MIRRDGKGGKPRKEGSTMGELRVGINGFGRIGRCTLKQLIGRKNTRVVGINDLADIGDLAYLLKYDSVHGWYAPKVDHDESTITVGEERIRFFARSDPSQIPWKEIGADVVIESTGAFRKRSQAAGHLSGGAKRVIISAPSDDADGMFVMGVNHETYDPAKHVVVSNASCTTNSLAPVAKVLHERFGVEHLMMTTVHAYTSSQSLMDIPTRKRRRGRAAALSIVPTTTGAARATGKVIPELEGRTDGMALRVPVPDGSVTDIVATLRKPVTAEAVNRALVEASKEPRMKGILRVTDEALVSRDIIGDTHSSIVDSESTMVLRDHVVKVLAWYDNEWGYSARLVDLAALMHAKGA